MKIFTDIYTNEKISKLVYILKPKPKYSNLVIEKLKSKSKILKTGLQNRNWKWYFFNKLQAL